jgi:SAM-dependent MidA family methyltransferase
MTLAAFSENVRITADLDEISADPLPGVVFGNELLDALPFHVVEWSDGHWQERRVAQGDDGFAWENADITFPGLHEALGKIGNDFPDGYITEIRANYRAFFEPLTRCLTRGLLVWPDYGFARPEYYHPARNQGTLRTFSKHRAGEDPFVSVGEIDITAHVDFTAVAEAAISLGAVPATFKSQGTWLTEVAREWLVSLEGNPDLEKLRQFQTLTHPSHLGGCFHVIELAWNQSCMPSAADFHRLGLP